MSAHTKLSADPVGTLVAEVAALRAEVAEVPVLVARIAALEALVVPKPRMPTPAALALFDALTEIENIVDRVYGSAEVLDWCPTSAALRRRVHAVARPGKAQAQRLGRVLATMDDHVRHGIRLRRLNDAEHAARWVFEVVQGD